MKTLRVELVDQAGGPIPGKVSVAYSWDVLMTDGSIFTDAPRTYYSATGEFDIPILAADDPGIEPGYEAFTTRVSWSVIAPDCNGRMAEQSVNTRTIQVVLGDPEPVKISDLDNVTPATMSGVWYGSGGGGGVSDHGALTGLGDDDHTQYALANGTRGAFAPTSHTHTAAELSNSTATGRSLITATDAAAARTAIGAGTSDLTIGTTGTTAAAGNRAASETATGMVELATTVEATTGTDTTRAVTPAGVKAVADTKAAVSHTHVATTDLTATGTKDSSTFLRGDNTWATPTGVAAPDASTTVKGIVELATNAETTTGTDTVRAVTPAGVKAVADTKAAVSHTHTASQVSDSTATGRALLTATDAATARTAIGAGTSSFSGAYADLSGKPTLGTAAAAATGDFATAAQGVKADSALQVATAQPINTQTGTTYTLVASDAGKVVTLDNTGAITLNAPGSVFTAGQQVDVIVLNTGMATVVGTSGAAVNGTPSLVSRARYSAFTVKWLSATSAIVIGDLA